MPRIVHFGVGNFHRAHQAWYTVGTGWSMTGIVMSNAAQFDKMAQNKNRYRLGIWDQSGLIEEIISIHDRAFLATRHSNEIAAEIADAETQIVTLTITEKGYCLNNDGKGLDFDAAPIARDLQSGAPVSAIGLLAQGLRERFEAGGTPLTLISCDNLAENSNKLRAALLDYLATLSPPAADWVRAHCTFPNTMVDRITPRLSEEERSEGGGDGPQMPLVRTERFSEWIVEDHFAGERPPWDELGALFVSDVSSYEERKLRLLNAAHSKLAYQGILAGHRYVHEAIADPTIRAGVLALWDEAQITISDPAAATIEQYRKDLLDRFAVAAMRHDLHQIAMDGSLKLKERIVPTIEYRSARELPVQACLDAVSAWIAFLEQRVRAGSEIFDPNAEAIAACFKPGVASEAGFARLCAMVGVPAKLIGDVSRLGSGAAIVAKGRGF